MTSFVFCVFSCACTRRRRLIAPRVHGEFRRSLFRAREPRRRSRSVSSLSPLRPGGPRLCFVSGRKGKNKNKYSRHTHVVKRRIKLVCDLCPTVHSFLSNRAPTYPPRSDHPGSRNAGRHVIMTACAVTAAVADPFRILLLDALVVRVAHVVFAPTVLFPERNEWCDFAFAPPPLPPGTGTGVVSTKRPLQPVRARTRRPSGVVSVWVVRLFSEWGGCEKIFFYTKQKTSRFNHVYTFDWNQRKHALYLYAIDLSNLNKVRQRHVCVTNYQY